MQLKKIFALAALASTAEGARELKAANIAPYRQEVCSDKACDPCKNLQKQQCLEQTLCDYDTNKDKFHEHGDAGPGSGCTSVSARKRIIHAHGNGGQVAMGDDGPSDGEIRKKMQEMGCADFYSQQDCRIAKRNDVNGGECYYRTCDFGDVGHPYCAETKDDKTVESCQVPESGPAKYGADPEFFIAFNTGQDFDNSDDGLNVPDEYNYSALMYMAGVLMAHGPTPGTMCQTIPDMYESHCYDVPNFAVVEAEMGNGNQIKAVIAESKVNAVSYSADNELQGQTAERCFGNPCDYDQTRDAWAKVASGDASGLTVRSGGDAYSSTMTAVCHIYMYNIDTDISSSMVRTVSGVRPPFVLKELVDGSEVANYASCKELFTEFINDYPTDAGDLNSDGLHPLTLAIDMVDPQVTGLAMIDTIIGLYSSLDGIVDISSD